MAIPDAHLAIVTEEKVRDYLLNLEHPEGGSKATWYHSLGYERSAWRVLADDLLQIAHACDRFETQVGAYGTKYLAAGRIGCNGRIGAVLTIWIVEGDAAPRLVTAYPDNRP